MHRDFPIRARYLRSSRRFNGPGGTIKRVIVHPPFNVCIAPRAAVMAQAAIITCKERTKRRICCESPRHRDIHNRAPGEQNQQHDHAGDDLPGAAEPPRAGGVLHRLNRIPRRQPGYRDAPRRETRRGASWYRASWYRASWYRASRRQPPTGCVRPDLSTPIFLNRNELQMTRSSSRPRAAHRAAATAIRRSLPMLRGCAFPCLARMD